VCEKNMALRTLTRELTEIEKLEFDEIKRYEYKHLKKSYKAAQKYKSPTL
jgi:hypothetical protein